MYGTLGRMTPKAGKRDELVAMMSSRPSDGVPTPLTPLSSAQ